MPETKDLLEQFLVLPRDRQEQLVGHFVEMLPPSLQTPVSLKNGASFPSIVSTPNVCGGSARLIRTRIPVWLLQHMRTRGFSDAKILECYPTLTASDLVQAWGYVAAHQAEIDEEIAENERY